jgi:hypothetical protein
MLGRFFLAILVAALLLLAVALAITMTRMHAPLNEPLRLRSTTMSVPSNTECRTRNRARQWKHESVTYVKFTQNARSRFLMTPWAKHERTSGRNGEGTTLLGGGLSAFPLTADSLRPLFVSRLFLPALPHDTLI